MSYQQSEPVLIEQAHRTPSTHFLLPSLILLVVSLRLMLLTAPQLVALLVGLLHEVPFVDQMWRHQFFNQ